MSTFITHVPGIVTLYMGPSHKEANAAFVDSETTGCQLVEINDLGQQVVKQVKKHPGFTALSLSEIRNIQRRAASGR